jgi:hypothetical protein
MMIPKIAFLFLTISNVYHEMSWINYFHGREGQYSLYAHPKKAVTKNSFLHHAVIPSSETTTWANTMNAQIALLKEALKDPDNSKFIFVSESTIPLTTFDVMYERLTSDPRSQFGFRKNPHNFRTFGGIKKLYKNPQWLILNRKHAQLMVDDTSLIKNMIQYPHDQEHYPSTLLARHKVLHEIIKNNATLCIWEGGSHPHEFTNLATDPRTDYLLKCIKNKRFLFGRKFHKTCDLSLLQTYLPELYH